MIIKLCFSTLFNSYGRTNQRLGQLLIDITATFEDEFHELEVFRTDRVYESRFTLLYFS